jgi:hypothetical protein
VLASMLLFASVALMAGAMILGRRRERRHSGTLSK